VARHAVGLETVRNLSEQVVHLGLAPGAAHAGS
jgi:hypothetical protein